MGRTTPSNPVTTPAQKRDARAKKAKQTINKDIPALLNAYPRARKGVESAEIFGKVQGGESQVREGAGPNGHGKGRLATHDDQSSKVTGKHGRQSIGRQRRRRSVNEEPEDDEVDNSIGGVRLTPPTSARQVSSATHDLDKNALTVNESNPSALTASPRPRIRIRVADTLDVAHDLLNSLSKSQSQPSHSSPYIVILNMCSPLRPGGGFLTGATSQEESICMRTTLLPSLREEFYRLPEVGGVYTADVLVFRSSGADGNMMDLTKSERWWVDVVSAGMLRFPEVEVGEAGGGNYVNSKDRQMVEDKMEAVMRIVKEKGAGKKRARRGLVLGAWGCGAYGNPVQEIAQCWRKVLLGDREEVSTGMESCDKVLEAPNDMDIVFAIKERKMAAHFAQHFGGGIQLEVPEGDGDDDQSSHNNETISSQNELHDKISQLEAQIARSTSQVQKEMLGKMLQKLKLSEGADDGQVC